MTQMAVVVFLALLMWPVSASSTWDYRFHRSTSPTTGEASWSVTHGTPSPSRTLHSEGGETKPEESAPNRTMNAPRTNFTQSTIPVISEGGASDQVYFEDKNATNRSRNNTLQSEHTSNSRFYDSVNKDHGDSTLSRYQVSATSSRTSRARDLATALAVEGRSLEEHHTGPRSDAVSSYYDFLVNEGSYKFWSVFQVFTAALLIYSAFAAVYYAKYTFATMDYPDYLDDGFFFRRSGADRAQKDDVYYDYEYEDTTTSRPQESTFLGMSSATFQRIMDALSSKKYS